MSTRQVPLRYPVAGAPDYTRTFKSQFSGLPLEVLGALGEDGLGGYAGIFEDFMKWTGPVAEGAAAGWLLSGPTGAATITLPNVREGAALLTTDATASAVATLHGATTTGQMNFIYDTTKRMWVAARFNLLTVASMEVFFGVGTGDTSPTTSGTFPSDGIFFEKAASATDFDFHVRKDGTSTEKTAIGATLADATYLTLGFLVDLGGSVTPYWNGRALLSKAIAAGTANLPGAADVMQLMIGFLGASMTMQIDWLLAVQER